MRRALFAALVLLLVSVGVRAVPLTNGAVIVPNLDEPRLNAYLDGGGSKFMVELLVHRPEGDTRAQAQVYYKFEEFGTQAFYRFDFLSPAEIAGDVYIFHEDFDPRTREREVLFWNEELITPLKIDLDFTVFGDATMFDVFGFRLTGHQMIECRLSEEPYDGPQPMTSSEFNMVSGGTITLREYDYEAVNEFALFPKATVLTYNFSLPYEYRLKDDNGDLLFTLRYNWRDYKVFEGQRYASKYVIINHIVPGNSTEVMVSSIGIDDTFSFDIFDPELLGS